MEQVEEVFTRTQINHIFNKLIQLEKECNIQYIEDNIWGYDLGKRIGMATAYGESCNLLLDELSKVGLTFNFKTKRIVKDK